MLYPTCGISGDVTFKYHMRWPPAPLDPSCYMMLETNALAEADCQLPVRCGHVFRIQKSITWYKEEVFICAGTGHRSTADEASWAMRDPKDWIELGFIAEQTWKNDVCRLTDHRLMVARKHDGGLFYIAADSLTNRVLMDNAGVASIPWPSMIAPTSGQQCIARPAPFPVNDVDDVPGTLTFSRVEHPPGDWFRNDLLAEWGCKPKRVGPMYSGDSRFLRRYWINDTVEPAGQFVYGHSESIANITGNCLSRTYVKKFGAPWLSYIEHVVERIVSALLYGAIGVLKEFLIMCFDVLTSLDDEYRFSETCVVAVMAMCRYKRWRIVILILITYVCVVGFGRNPAERWV